MDTKDQNKQLEPTKAELEILQVLWETGPSTVREVNNELLKQKDVNYTTTLKLMQIMADKSILARDESQMKHVYRVAEDEQKTKNHLLEKFVQEDRVEVVHPKENLQAELIRTLPGNNEFVAYIDAIGEIDGTKCLIDWKTTRSRYSTEPEGLLSLDPQLICYSWISGIKEVALVVFVRKHLPEIQYLKASISDEHCREYGRLVESALGQIESGQFPAHSGIRFPQNGCLNCSHLGLCLNKPELVDINLTRKLGAADLDWLNELVD